MKNKQHAHLKTTKTSKLASTARSVIAALFVFALPACDKKPTEHSTVETIPSPERSLYQVDSDALFEFGEVQYTTALLENKKLTTTIVALTNEPSEDNLKHAQAQWQAYREASVKLDYFYHVSRVAPAKFNELDRLQFRIAAHPIQPGFIDSFGEYNYSGLVHDIGFELSEPRLEQQHGLTDPEEVVLGLYAIEYLLFGEQGKRPASDFEIRTSIPKNLAEKGIKSTDELSSNRRRTLLKLQTSLLEKDMLSMAPAWQRDNSASLLAKFKKLDLEERNRIFGQAFTNYLTETLIDLAGLSTSDEVNTNPTSQNTDDGNSQRIIKLKLGLAQQLSPMLIYSDQIAELSDRLNASSAALLGSGNLENNIPVQKTDEDSPNALSKTGLTKAYQQLKLAIDQIQ